MDEYLSRLRALRWQAMAVRGEEDQALGSLQVPWGRALHASASLACSCGLCSWLPAALQAVVVAIPPHTPHQLHLPRITSPATRCCRAALLLQELEAARRLPRGVQELGEEDMGRLAAAAREAGLEELFLTALKLSAATPR